MNRRKLPLFYCDYIAHIISKALRKDASDTFDTFIANVKGVVYKPNSYVKTVDVVDINGMKYKVTVEPVS
tara:strand:- start:199 stop:408 length:210 start_codon:yes stop_codon:yes gene_type:complete